MTTIAIGVVCFAAGVVVGMVVAEYLVEMFNDE